MKKWIIVIGATLSLICGGDSLAVRPSVSIDSIVPGSTPFISFVKFTVTNPAAFVSVRFDVRPKPGSQTRPLAATYTASYLQKAGYLKTRSGVLTLPVFGLYQNYTNSVRVRLRFSDSTSQTTSVSITTPAFDGGTITSPTIVQPRLQNTTLSYDYVLMKRSDDEQNCPVIIDSDSEVRWVGTAGAGGQQAILFDNAIYYGQDPSFLVREEFDGRKQIMADYSSLNVTQFHHNFDYGREGIIVAVDTTSWVESTNYEVDVKGNILRTWNLWDIVSKAMIAGGDDPSQFVFPAPSDWFHNNATTYRPSDDSFIVSSRENFVIAVDYDTQAIKWILGDTSKHWFQFPSLQAFALGLGPDTLAPIGEHAVSIVRDELLCFDNGTASLTQTPPGMSRTYSAPRKYSIVGNTATETYHYLANPSIKSAFCSSVYEDAKDNFLIDYTQANNVSNDLVALDATGAIAFYYRYDQDGCGTAWNSFPIHLENLLFE
jgi:arylsulfate sulfotransferase